MTPRLVALALSLCAAVPASAVEVVRPVELPAAQPLSVTAAAVPGLSGSAPVLPGAIPAAPVAEGLPELPAAAAAAPRPAAQISAAYGRVPAGAAAPAPTGPAPLAGAAARRDGESAQSWSARLWARLLRERGGGSYQNPVFSGNVPDPGAARAGKSYYVAATSNRAEDKFPLLKSSNLRDWEHVGFLFPRDQRPAWASGFFWAPELHRVGKGWVAYYTAQKDGHLVLGAATAKNIEGPWRDLGRPMLENPRVGLIDSHRFEDHDGRHYLYWKEDANGLSPKERTGLFVQELSQDGLSFVGRPTRLLENDAAWEGDLIEGPWVERHGKYYYLFYSANDFASDKYALGVARALSPTGPFQKLGRPILRSNERWKGPGHHSIVRRANWADRARAALGQAFPNGSGARRWLAPVVSLLARLGGRDYILYHAWEGGRVGGREPFASTFQAPFTDGENPRMLLLDRLRYERGWPRVHDGTPSVAPQPLPSSR